MTKLTEEQLADLIKWRASACLTKREGNMLDTIDAIRAEQSALVAAAYHRAAERLEALADMPVNTKEQNEILRYAAKDHILALIDAPAERTLNLIVAQRVVEEAQLWSRNTCSIDMEGHRWVTERLKFVLAAVESLRKGGV